MRSRVLRSVTIAASLLLLPLTDHLAPALAASVGGGPTQPDTGSDASRTPAFVGAFGEKLTIDSKGLTFLPPDDVVKLRIGGRLHYDFGTTDKSTDPDDLFRRSWIEAHASVRGGTEVVFQYDFAKTSTPIFDAGVAYSGIAPFMLTVGNVRAPMSLDRLTNTNTTLFTETALPIAFTDVRDFGIALGANGERWTGTFGVFGQNASLGVTGDGIIGGGRITFAPLLDATQVLHLGLSGTYRALEGHGPALSFSSTPETSLYTSAEALVDTGTIAGATGIKRLAGEGAYGVGPVEIQGEYIWTGVDRRDGLAAASFHGEYIQAEWVMNGAGRVYELKPAFGTTYATFAGVKVQDGQRVTRGGVGVFELGARLSRIDLRDAQIRGGVETDGTVGINWYPDDNIRFMFDYVHANAVKSTVANQNRDLFVGRVQLYW